MSDLPSFLETGERARLFPVLSDSSREGRATSIFLSCVANVREFADDLLSSAGRGIGITSKISTYTEVCFKSSASKIKHRPDGLVIVSTGSSSWSALIEAKIGNAVLDPSQIETYLKIARDNGIDAVITISNQHAPSPTDHPIKLDKKIIGPVTLSHWSWMDILTAADLLLTNKQIEDREQRILLNEFRRFLTHDSTGVRGFDKMPPEWPELVRDVGTGAKISAHSEMLKSVIRAWHMELHDLSLILSRQISVPVSLKLTNQESRHPEERLKNDCAAFAAKQCMSAQLTVPKAAADIEVNVDVRARTIAASSKLIAPTDKKGTAARINWLLRQIKDITPEDTYVRVHWPYRGHTQYPLQQLRESLEDVLSCHPDITPSAFEILIVKQPGKRFSQLSGFVEDVEKIVPYFYGTIGSKLKAWQPSAPNLKPTRNDSSDVTTEAISEDAEEAVAELSEESEPTPKKKFWF